MELHSFKSKRDIARYLGIGFTTFSNYFDRGSKIVRPDYRKKIYDLTRIDSFRLAEPAGAENQILASWIKNTLDKTKKDIGIKQKEKTKNRTDNSTKAQETKHAKDALISTQSGPYTLRSQHIQSEKGGRSVTDKSVSDVVINEVVNSFFQLAKALQELKRSTQEMRREIRKKIPARDMGYVLSFLRAIYDEDHFSDFLFFSDYKLGGDADE